MPYDSAQGKIYAIRNNHDDKVWVGWSTLPLSAEMEYHRVRSPNWRRSHRKLYKAFDEIGFENFYIKLLEDYPCQDVYQLTARKYYYSQKMDSYKNVTAPSVD